MRRIILFPIIVSCFLFGSASVLPIFSIEPAVGEWTALAEILSPAEMQSKSFSLLEGVKLLWQENEKMLACIIGLFSLLLPVIKLSVLWAEALFSGSLSRKWMGFLQAVSRYAMLEVFLVAMTVLLIKQMPGGSRITLESGFYAFAVSVLLSLVVAQFVETKKRESNLSSFTDRGLAD